MGRRCDGCGYRNAPGTRFCAKCGRPLGGVTSGEGTWRSAAAIVGCLLVVVAGCVFALFACEQVRVQETMTEHGDDAGSPALSSEVNPMDYYLAHSQLVSKTGLLKSSCVQTEREASQSYAERGFTEVGLSSAYGEDGSYLPESDVVDGESTKHPIYEGIYESVTGDAWKIYSVDGEFMAYPVDIQSFVPAMQFIVSESDHIVSYDSASNAFYRIVPEGDLLAVVVVERLDAQTLDSFATGGGR